MLVLVVARHRVIVGVARAAEFLAADALIFAQLSIRDINAILGFVVPHRYRAVARKMACGSLVAQVESVGGEHDGHPGIELRLQALPGTGVVFLDPSLNRETGVRAEIGFQADRAPMKHPRGAQRVIINGEETEPARQAKNHGFG